MLRSLDKQKPNATPQEEEDYMMENFPTYPNVSVETGVLESSEGRVRDEVRLRLGRPRHVARHL